MGRKSFKIEEFVTICNGVLRLSDPELSERRKGVMLILEQTLMSSGNYKGFRYLSAKECEGKPGVNLNEDGSLLPYPERFKDTDPTRVQY